MTTAICSKSPLSAEGYPLLRYFGLFAPGCKLRKRIVPGRPANRTRCCAAHPGQSTAAPAVTAAPGLRPLTPTDRAHEAHTPDALIERVEHPASANTALAPSLLDATATTAPPLRAPRDGGTRIPWADLMKHGFDLDVLVCPRCSATMRVLAVVQNREEARRYLEHVGIAARNKVPQRAWDPVPIDPAARTSVARSTRPPDDWVA